MKILTLGSQDYQQTWQHMSTFTAQRDAATEDEIWLLQHPAVFTQGYNGQAEHILQKTDIPIVETDRGGQVTYHGPGQLVAYLLCDLKRQKIGTKQFVANIENIIITNLANYGIHAETRCDAPGVYVDGAKICSLGLRIKHGYSYHGLALNVDMDLTPFSYINPCGFANMQMCQIKDFVKDITIDDVSQELKQQLTEDKLFATS